jgi:pantetheine-phosphate adenylyltransferase
MKVCIGGTFNRFHKGHKFLIRKALELAGERGFVFIGITDGEIIKNKRNAASFEEREKAIEQFLSEEKVSKNIIIQPIYDKFGPSVKKDFDAIVVSPETRATAEEINKERKKLQKKPLKIVQISFVLAEDNLPINSTRIQRREINENGRIL